MSLTTVVENCKLLAVGWKNKTVKMFISTCGTALPGQPHQKYRYSHDGDVVVTEINRPQLVSQYFGAASKIDVHNHFRKGLLNIETVWGTQTWWHRLAATFFGVVVTDAFIAYNYEQRSEMTIRNFVKEVSIFLLFNTFDGSDMVPQRRQSRDEHPPSVPVIQFEPHPLRRLSQLSLYKGKMRQKGAHRKCHLWRETQCPLLLCHMYR